MRTRRPVARRLAVLLPLLVAACGDATTPADDANVITVGIIGGSWTTRVDDAIRPQMEAAGITVKYIPGTAQELKPKLIAARGGTPPFDVVELDDQSYYELRRGGFLQPYDPAAMPNLAQIHPRYQDGWQAAYWINIPALIYNVDKLREAGIQPPKRFSDLADPGLRGHVLLSDLHHYMGYYGLVALAYENGGDERNPQPGFDALAKIQPHSYFTSSAASGQLWRSGDFWAGTTVANAASRLIESGVNVAVVQPPVGDHAIMVVRGSFAITKGSRKKAAAEAFINATLAADVQRKFYDGTGILPSNTETMRSIAANPRKPEVKFIGMREEDIATAYIPDFAAIEPRDWVTRFQTAIDKQPKVIMLRLLGQLVLLTLMVVVIGLAACGDKQEERGETTITVGMIGGMVANRIKEAVEPRLAAQGIRVKYVYGTAQELLPKLIAARGQTPPLDVLEVDDQTYLELRRGNLIEKYDPAHIPNAQQVYPNLRDEYRIGYWVTQPAILYNVDRLREAGLKPPKTFTDLADPAYAGRIMLTDLRHYNGYNTLVALAYENGGDETRPDAAFDIVRKIRPHSYFTSALAAQQLWRNQDVWVGVSTANTGVRLKEAGINVAVVQPPVAGHKVILARGSLAIATGTTRKAAAEAFINAVVEKDLQKDIYDVSSIIPANAEALRAIIAAGDAPFKVRRTELQKLDEKDITGGFVPRFELIDVRSWTRRFQTVIDSQPK